ncbi:MAG: imelysin family protein [Pseudomonadota bacterium]
MMRNLISAALTTAALTTAAFTLFPAPALADDAPPDHGRIAERAVEAHILPRYAAFAEASEALLEASQSCDVATLRQSYHASFDAWMGVQHIAIGPVEAEMRRFAIAFWPDTKGFTRKALGPLIAAEDPVIDDPVAFAKLSVAARGLLALERLLFDEKGPRPLAPGYRCRLAQAIARDLETSAAALLAGWRGEAGFQRTLLTPGPENALYPAPEDVTRALFTSLDGGLQALIDLRLGRPLGSFETPRPKRAEAWRSRRSLRNVAQSLEALQALYAQAFAPALSDDERARIDAAFARTRDMIDRGPTPLSSAVASPQTRFQIEAIQSQLAALQRRLRGTLAPALGVSLGFNALDGD